MALFTRNYTGTIDGRNAWSYCLNNKDYKVEEYDERVEIVKKFLELLFKE